MNDGGGRKSSSNRSSTVSLIRAFIQNFIRQSSGLPIQPSLPREHPLAEATERPTGSRLMISLFRADPTTSMYVAQQCIHPPCPGTLPIIVHRRRRRQRRRRTYIQSNIYNGPLMTRHSLHCLWDTEGWWVDGGGGAAGVGMNALNTNFLRII